MALLAQNGSRNNWSDIDCRWFDNIYNIQVTFINYIISYHIISFY